MSYLFSGFSLSLLIKVNDGENVVHVQEFYDKRDSGEFVDVYADSDDSLKLCGVTCDGVVYVTVKPYYEQTEEERVIWSARLRAASQGCIVADPVILAQKEAAAPNFRDKVCY